MRQKDTENENCIDKEKGVFVCDKEIELQDRDRRIKQKEEENEDWKWR